MRKINSAIVSALLVMALVVPCTIMTPAAANAVVISVELYNDEDLLVGVPRQVFEPWIEALTRD